MWPKLTPGPQNTRPRGWCTTIANALRWHFCADVRVLNNAMVALLQQSYCLLDGPGALPGVHMTYTAQIWMPYSMCTPCAPCVLRQHLVM